MVRSGARNLSRNLFRNLSRNLSIIACARLLMLAGMLAGAWPARAGESLDELRRQLKEADDDMSVLVDDQLLVKDPNTFIVTDLSGSFEPFSRSEAIARLDGAVARGTIPRAAANATIAKYEELKRALDRMLKSMLENKAARRQRLVDAIAELERTPPATENWQQGGGVGQFAVSCESSSGILPDSGPAAFIIKNSQVTGSWGQGTFQGRVAPDGTASGTGTGPYGTVTWWGRFWRTPDGAVAGHGSISPGPGDAKCSGSWSLP